MSESTCYYYDEQRNRCNCYVNENLNELLAENAKLRDYLERKRYLMDFGRLVYENTKLRELVRKLVGLDSLYEVPAYNVSEWSRRMDSIHDEMRELGVEVDG